VEQVVGEVVESKCYGIIYKVTNLTNGKVYIGQTTYSLGKRMREHNYHAVNYNKTNVVFYQAIKKYGEDNFNWTVIDMAYNRAELDDKEEFWIDFYRSYVGFDDSHGYNMTLGGDGRSGYTHDDETRKKISMAHKGKRTLGDSHVARKVMQFSLDGKLVSKYDSAIEGANAVNGKLQNITDCCRGEKSKTVMGFIWIYEDDYSEEFLKDRINNLPTKSTKSKRIVQLDMDGNYVATHESAYSAGKVMGSDRSSIIKCCKKKIRWHKNFVWVYEEDYRE
jgi:group I intron endonuclease